MTRLRRQARPQSGAAILSAMLTVVLVASLATSMLWQQWRNVEVEAAQRTRTQSAWVLFGALDWARLILREDARKGGADHLGEPWAVPLAQTRLSTFLSNDRSDALAAQAEQASFVSGQVQDLQARLNVTNLLQDGKIHSPSQLAFARLFAQLNLPASELTGLTEQLLAAHSATLAAKPDLAAPLWPQEVAQLTWLGLSNLSLRRLQPFITLLPERTPVNLNTASAEVLYACVPGIEMADAQRLVQARSQSPLTTLEDARKALGLDKSPFNDMAHSVATRYFEVSGLLQIDQSTVHELSLLRRDGAEVKVLSRQRGASGLPAQAGALQ